MNPTGELLRDLHHHRFDPTSLPNYGYWFGANRHPFDDALARVNENLPPDKQLQLPANEADWPEFLSRYKAELQLPTPFDGTDRAAMRHDLALHVLSEMSGGRLTFYSPDPRVIAVHEQLARDLAVEAKNPQNTLTSRNVATAGSLFFQALATALRLAYAASRKTAPNRHQLRPAQSNNHSDPANQAARRELLVELTVQARLLQQHRPAAPPSQNNASSPAAKVPQTGTSAPTPDWATLVLWWEAVTGKVLPPSYIYGAGFGNGTGVASMPKSSGSPTRESVTDEIFAGGAAGAVAGGLFGGLLGGGAEGAAGIIAAFV